MKTKRRPSTSDLGKLPTLLSMIDLAWLTLGFALVNADFAVERVRLPSIDAPGAAAAEKSGESHAVRLVVHAQGKIGLDGQLLDPAAVAQRVRSGVPGDQPLVLALVTTEDGLGPTTTLLELLHQFREAKVQNPVHCLVDRSESGGASSPVERAGDDRASGG